jgi:hypothetical protein
MKPYVASFGIRHTDSFGIVGRMLEFFCENLEEVCASDVTSRKPTIKSLN